MGINDISQLIVNFGFPIVACGCMAWYVKYITDKNYNEIDKIKETINNNTLALTKLVDYLRGVDNEED